MLLLACLNSWPHSVFLLVVGVGNGTKMLGTMLAGSKVSCGTVRNIVCCAKMTLGEFLYIYNEIFFCMWVVLRKCGPVVWHAGPKIKLFKTRWKCEMLEIKPFCSVLWITKGTVVDAALCWRDCWMSWTRGTFSYSYWSAWNLHLNNKLFLNKIFLHPYNFTAFMQSYSVKNTCTNYQLYIKK